MGTNFYHFSDQVGAPTLMETGLHIGKFSGGWVFHFQAYEKPELKTVAQYKEFLKEGVIYNEYNEKVSYKEFWELVESSLKSDPWDPAPPYSFDNLPEDDKISAHLSGIEEWMNSGFMFTETIFVKKG